MTIDEAIIKVEDLLRKDKSFENVLKRIEKNGKWELEKIPYFHCLVSDPAIFHGKGGYTKIVD